MFRQRSPKRPAIRQIALPAGGHAVGQGRLQAAGAGAGQREDGVLRAEDVLQVVEHLGEHLAELGGAVEDHRLGQLEQRLFGNRRRAGGQQTKLHASSS